MPEFDSLTLILDTIRIPRPIELVELARIYADTDTGLLGEHDSQHSICRILVKTVAPSAISLIPLHETRVQEQQGTTGESEDRSTIKKASRFAARTFLPPCLFAALLIVCLQIVWPNRETERHRQLLDAIEQLNPGASCSPQLHNEIFIEPSQPELSRGHPPPVDDQGSERNDVRVFRSGRAD